jgi:chitinase
MVQLDSNGVKKILSFGGWSFSTDHDSSPIFAQGVSSANRELFASNVVQFLTDNKLDGLDFDWEYPGATDIEGAAPGSPQDGLNYYKFLQSVKNKLPSGKSLSIALPASYWYLRGFPVMKMAQVVDYFIYMTYDLDGQWDYGSKFSNSGCKTGNCLRSHVNSTETDTALSMITKAGVPANKIMVGVSSYGRSFKMVNPSCTGVMCKFSGTPKLSNADPGYCTGTPGYISNAEIAELSENDDVEQWFDTESSSNILTWDGNWIAYMDDDQKDSRISWVKGLNFAGTTDWAVDLQEYQTPLDRNSSIDDDYPDLSCDKEYEDLDALEKDADNIPSYCAPLYILTAMGTLLNDTLKKYDEVKNDYDGKFKYYEQYINDLVNPQLENWMDNFDRNEETKQGLGNRFFDCKYKHKGEDSWRYDGECPVPNDIMNDGKLNFDPDVSFEIDYTLKDKNEFEKALGSELGIQAGWIQWEDWGGYDRCEAGTGGNTNGPDARRMSDNSTHDNSTHITGIPCIPVDHLKKNFPRKKASITITDPKQVMESAIPTIDGIRQQFKAAVLSITLGMYNATLDPSDAATALSTPVQMLAQAVAHMENVKDIGGEIEEKKKKETILLIVSLVLMIVPFVTEIGAELAGMVMVARFAFITGELANAAMAVVDIIDEPTSAPFAVMGLLAGAAAGKGAKRIEQTFKDAAKARRTLGDAGALGKRFKEVDDKVAKVMPKTCTR